MNRTTVATALLLGFASGIAVSAAPVPSTTAPYEPAEVLTAKRLNDDFANIETRLAALEVLAYPANRSSTYLGQSALFNVPDIGGYSGAAAKCSTQFATAAHMCTAHDLVVAQSRGQSIDKSGRYSAGLRTEALTDGTVNDCHGFTDGDAGLNSPWWSADVSDNKWQTHPCNTNKAFLCCAD